MIHITLPFPVSVNALYAGMGRRHKSKRYQRWEIAANNALRYQKWTPYPKEITLQAIYRFGRPDKRTRDLCNLEKAISDLLVHAGIIHDDSLIHRITMEWADVKGAEIEIYPYGSVIVLKERAEH